MRREYGGWAREVTQRELPGVTTLAGVNMRLAPGGVREMHWHFGKALNRMRNPGREVPEITHADIADKAVSHDRGGSKSQPRATGHGLRGGPEHLLISPPRLSLVVLPFANIGGK